MGKKTCEICRAKPSEQECVTVCKGCVKKDNEDNSIVLNEVLAYIGTYHKRATSLQLKLAMCTHFHEDQLENAKKILIQCLEEVDIDIGEYTKSRQDSARRSMKEAIMEDIIQIFKAMDLSMDANAIPTFAAADVSKLPPVGPEEAGNLMSFYEVLNRQQDIILRLERNLNELRDDVTGLQANQLRPTYATRTAHGLQNTWPSPQQSVQQPVRKANEPPQRDNTTAIGSSSQPHGQRPVSNQLAADDGFQTVMPKRPPRPPGEKSKSGSATGSNMLKSGPVQFHVQLTNVNPTLVTDDIKNFIISQDDTIVPEEIKDTSSEGYHTKRFLVTFKMTDYDKIMSEEFWPDKIYFKRWFPPRRPQQLRT